MPKPKHLIEALAVNILFAAFKTLPLDIASWAGSFMARSIGPYLGAHKTAEKNLRMVFPDMSNKEVQRVLSKMWDNLGRVAAELPHLPRQKLGTRITVIGEENFPAGDAPVLFFSGHYGNWELLPRISYSYGVPVTLVYRQANNVLVDNLIARIRSAHTDNMFAKGPRGGFKMARAIKAGESMAMLIDQKMNEGIPVPFFGKDAMTPPAIAQLALRKDMPIIPARVVRTKGVHFETTIYPPLVYQKTGDDEKDTLAIMTAINKTLESWIREHPEQWFWVHKRWPNS